MRRITLVLGVLAMAVFGPVGTVAAPTVAHAAECKAGPVEQAEAGQCLWDGGEGGHGFQEEGACQEAAERYGDQDPEHGYACEDVSGDSSWWVVRD
ncbi:hypothetical protein ACIQF6_18320 [Kitasatospora sp. NPDC092948]|uniref:hypothetical protein n=1 Tax=Kitasatospora sp. NPDC092948 TaxID=3364088 RepID=UPI00380D361D